MTFQAYCFVCEKKVAALTLLGRNKVKLALDNDGDVEVMHTTENHVDHKWKLNSREKDNLRGTLDQSLL